MRLCIVLLAFLLQSYHTYSQKSSRNGYRIENSDTIRIFLVFAEMVNDPQDVGTGNPYYTQYDPNWIAGNLPLNKDTYFDPNLFSSSLSGYMTKYFYQASFGKFITLADYYDSLVQVNYNSSYMQYDQDNARTNAVLSEIDQHTGNSVITARGLYIDTHLSQVSTCGNFMQPASE